MKMKLLLVGKGKKCQCVVIIAGGRRETIFSTSTLCTQNEGMISEELRLKPASPTYHLNDCGQDTSDTKPLILHL